jgi:hypothetical protein
MDEQILPQQNVSGISGAGEISLYQYFISSPLFAEFKDFEGPERKLFLNEYSSMSPSLKNFIASTETATYISALGIDYQLDDNQVSQIAGTLREIATGKIFIKDISATISSRLGIDDIKAGEIANKVVSKTFSPIIEDIKRIQRTKFPEKIAEMQKGAQPATMTRPSAMGEIRPGGMAQPITKTAPSVPPIQNPSAPQPIKPIQNNQPQAVRPASPQPQVVRPPQPSVQPPSDPQIRQAPLVPPLQRPNDDASLPAGRQGSATASRPNVMTSRPQTQQPQQTLPAQPPRPQPQPVEPQQAPLPKPKPQLPPRPDMPLVPPSELKNPEYKVPGFGNTQQPMGQKPPMPNIKQNGGLPDQDAQKTLEAELEKVAGVLDLRNKSVE